MAVLMCCLSLHIRRWGGPAIPQTEPYNIVNRKTLSFYELVFSKYLSPQLFSTVGWGGVTMFLVAIPSDKTSKKCWKWRLRALMFYDSSHG